MNIKRIGRMAAAALFIGGLMTVSAYGAGPDTPGSWSQDEAGTWYFCDEDGSPYTGWIQDKGQSYYLYPDGHMARGEVTPDGYRVDENGVWYQMEKDILGRKFTVPARFVPPSAMEKGWGGAGQGMLEISGELESAFPETRRLQVGDDAVEYTSGDGREIYLGLYKDYENNGYRLDLHIRLDKSSAGDRAAAYDYGIFEAMVVSVSSAPEEVCRAVYSSWQEQNVYGISRFEVTPVGDWGLIYEAGQGYGKFFLRPL